MFRRRILRRHEWRPERDASRRRSVFSARRRLSGFRRLYRRREDRGGSKNNDMTIVPALPNSSGASFIQAAEKRADRRKRLSHLSKSGAYSSRRATMGSTPA